MTENQMMVAFLFKYRYSTIVIRYGNYLQYVGPIPKKLKIIAAAANHHLKM
jgi:hypothetical protein